MTEDETLAQDMECENCMRLTGQAGALEDANERLMEQIMKLERNAEQMVTTLGDQAATIRRLTEERLGPEKSLYEQAKGIGIGIAPSMYPPKPEEDPVAGD